MTQLCWAVSLELRHVSTIEKKSLLNSNTSSTCHTIWQILAH